MLDGSKTGVTIRPEKYKEDQKKYSSRQLEWKRSIYKEDREQTSSTKLFAERIGPAAKRKFIMDRIRDDLNNSKAAYDETILARLGPLRRLTADTDLTKHWDEFLARVEQAKVLYAAEQSTSRPEASNTAGRSNTRSEASNTTRQSESPSVIPNAARQSNSRMSRLRDEIMTQVKNLRKEQVRRLSSVQAKQGKGFTNLPIQRRQDILRASSKEFHTLVANISDEFVEWTEDQLLPWMASYAYLHDHEQSADTSTGWSRWPWNVAMGALCTIKAGAVSKGCSKTVTMDFYSRFSISKKHIEMS